jgi:excinuclease UvrABC helicase subunit UvrB
VVKSLEEVRLSTYVADARTARPEKPGPSEMESARDPAARAALIAKLERRMKEAAANLEFEEAALIRDQLNELRAMGAPDVRREAAGAGGGRGRGRRRA